MIIKETRKVYLKLREAAKESQRQEMKIIETEVILEPYVFSDEFDKKIGKLLSFSQKPYFKFVNTIGKRAAVIIIALITALSITTLSVKAVREPVISFMISVYDKFTNILFNTDELESSYPTIIEESYHPEYIPEGYILKENNNFGNVIETIYSKGNDDLFFEQYIISSTQIGVDTEGTGVEILTVKGKEVLFYNNKGVNNIVWTDGVYGYKITGIIDKDDMIIMVKLTKH